MGARWIYERKKAGARSIALVAETQKDLEEVMVARILKVCPPDDRPTVRLKPVRLVWPDGAEALGYNGTEPDQLRGPEFDTAWVDELAKYRLATDLWDMLQFTMRRGDDPRVLVTTTPRPIPIIKSLVTDPGTAVTRGSTFDNAANLPKKFLDRLKEKYEGTRLGRQELDAAILDDLPGALWGRSIFDTFRRSKVPELVRIVVAVDPSGTKGLPLAQKRGRVKEKNDDVGIVVAGKGVDGRGYILADGTCNLSPAGWGKRAIDYYNGSWSNDPRLHSADILVAENNFGGAMVEHVITTIDPDVNYQEVFASRGKVARAEPVAALYEKGRISHVGSFPELEDQMCLFAPDGFIGDGSPDRADAAIWALTKLFLEDTENAQMFLSKRLRS